MFMDFEWSDFRSPLKICFCFFYQMRRMNDRVSRIRIAAKFQLPFQPKTKTEKKNWLGSLSKTEYGGKHGGTLEFLSQ